MFFVVSWVFFFLFSVLLCLFSFFFFVYFLDDLFDGGVLYLHVCEGVFAEDVLDYFVDGLLFGVYFYDEFVGVFCSESASFEFEGGCGFFEFYVDDLCLEVAFLYCLEASVVDYCSVVYDDYSFAESFNILHVVCGDDEGCFFFFVYFDDEVAHDVFGYDVEADAGFVEEY